MNYTTLAYNGVEKSLADWKISGWNRTIQNQASDSFNLTILTPIDGSDIFPFGAQIIVRINRTTATVNPTNPTLPQSGAISFSGGTQWFWGYCIDNDRVGNPGEESFNYKFVGPFEFFFARLIFQKLQLSWNGVNANVADWQSDVILGLSLTTLTGSSDTIPDSTATNLMSIAQQVKEIAMYAQADSAYQQQNNGLGWRDSAITGQPAHAQFQCDQLTSEIDGTNYDLLASPSANCLLTDYASGAVTGKTSIDVPTGSYMLRAPLDAVTAITCSEALRRVLQWLGGIGSPVIWTDHSQSPPQLHIATKDQLTMADPGDTTISQRLAGGYALNLPLTSITVKNKIKKRTDLIPAGVHLKYKISSTYLGANYSQVVNDVACRISGTLTEGIGVLGDLTYITGGTFGGAIAGGTQTAMMAIAKTATSIVQTLDFQGDQTTAAQCTITTKELALVDPDGSGAYNNSGADGGFWGSIFNELYNFQNVTLAKDNTGTAIPPTIDDGTGATTYYTAGAWTGTEYLYRITDGQAADWMLLSASTPEDRVSGQTVKATIRVKFAYSEAATPNTISYREYAKEVTITTLPSGTYNSTPVTSSGEPVPYGLAGYLLALESIPQYEGSITVQETEISDVCPIGNTLNITGGLTEWATMQATIQSVRYGDNGQTEITFGPAKHLGPSQFVARFRNNVGPRWFLLMNVDPTNTTNSGPTQLGSNIPASCTGDGSVNKSFSGLLTNQPAFEASVVAHSPQTMPGGVLDESGQNVTRYSGTVASGQLGFRQGAGTVIAQGPSGTNPGESMAWIRLHLGDLQNSVGALQNLHIYLREIADCQTISGVPTSGFRLVLSSEFYTASIRAMADP